MNKEKVVFCTREQLARLAALDWLKNVIDNAIQTERELITDEIDKYNQDKDREDD